MVSREILDSFNIMCSPDKPLVWLSTTDTEGAPHLVPVCFVKTLEDGRMIIGNVFIKRSEKNVHETGKAALALAYKDDGFKGYMVKGKAEVIHEGGLLESFRKEVLERSKGKRSVKSIIALSPEKAFSLEPRSGSKEL